jgi:hypothetical protein
MKKVYLCLLANLSAFVLSSQSFQWGKVEGEYAYDYGYGITNDNSGNVLVAGKYEAVGPGANFSGTVVPCTGNHDIFLASYSPSGSLNWIRTAGGTDGDYAEAVTTDKSSFIYISGEIEKSGGNGLISFSGSNITLQVAYDNDVFVAKYDMSGNLQWARSFGGGESEKGLCCAHDPAGNIYVCGYYTNTTVVNGNNVSGYGGRDIYVAKYDPNGTFQWFKNFGSAGRDEAKSIKCDAAGNVYICGMFSKNCTFGSVTLNTYNATSYFDMFVAKLDGSGNVTWVKTGGSDFDEVAWCITADNSGKIYLTGEFNAYADFGGGNTLTTTGSANIFVACYDNSGNIQWVRQAGGPLVDRARGIGFDGTNLMITGQFGGTASFGPRQVSAPTDDSSDVFIAGLSTAGDFLWAVSLDGPRDTYEQLGYESGNSVCGDGTGNVYATGSVLSGTAAATGTVPVAAIFGSQSVNGYSRTDAFITKIDVKNVAPVGVTENANNSAFTLYPNPGKEQLMLNFNQPVNRIDVSIISCTGAQVKECRSLTGSTHVIDVSTLSPGVYFMTVADVSSGINETKKIIIQ